MQAILVKFCGPTNTKGSRYKAICDAGSITIPMDYSLGTDGTARKAAEALCEKLGWTAPHYTPLVGGTLPGGDMAFVFTER